jgi:hypothetical protein
VKVSSKWDGVENDNVEIKVMRHEIAHALHHKTGLHTTVSTDTNTDNYFKIVKNIIKKYIEIDSTDDVALIESKKKLQSEYAGSNRVVGVENVFDHMSVADIVKATTLHYGYGHSSSYYKSAYGQIAEVLANTGEMYLTYVKTGRWNDNLENNFKELIPEIKKYWNKVYEQNI